MRGLAAVTRITVLAAAIAVLAGCRKELCYDHDHWKANVVAQWELVWERDYGRNWASLWNSPAGYAYDSLRPAPGGGIGAFVYREDGTYTERHIDADGGVLPVGEGRHSLLFYNDNTEYIVFSSMESWAQASASTRTRTRSTYAQNHGEESTVNSPDMLFGAWIEDYVSAGSPDATPIDLPVTLRPLVYKYVIIYEFESGIEYVRLARGALAGPSRSSCRMAARGRTRRQSSSMRRTSIWNAAWSAWWSALSVYPTTRTNTIQARRPGK